VIASNCPPVLDIALLAGGDLPPERAEVLLAHIALCDSCSRALAEAVQNLDSELTPDEEAAAQPLMKIAPMPPRRRTYSRYIGIAASVLLTLGAWFAWQLTRPEPIGRILARASEASRPFDWRLLDSGYVATHVELGAPKPAPAAVQEAEVAVERLDPSARGKQGAAYATGWLALLKGDPEAAIPALEQALQQAPQDADIATKLGIAYAAKADRASDRAAKSAGYHAAIDRFSQALRLEPDNLAALFNRGLAHSRLEEKAEAKADFQAYLAKDPQSPWSAEVRRWLTVL
jgi:tetratricopeptide (TPR) repeat protein